MSSGVGPYDPCPCGSGEKFKFCCGKESGKGKHTAQPATLEQAFQIAFQHHQAGQFPLAEQLYRQILAQQPNHAEALHHLGVIAAQTGRYESAVELIGRAIAIKPNFPEAYSNLGNALKDSGQLDEAIAAYRQAIALRPNYAEAHFNLGIGLYGKGQVGQAITAYRQSIAVRPNYAKGHYNLGIALLDQGEFVEAIAAFRKAIALAPNFAEAHNNLGNALKDTGQLDEAITALHQAIALKPDYAEAHSNLGNALKDNGHLDEAIAAYRQAIALKPDFAQAHYNLGLALQDNGQLDEAIRACRQSLSIRPDYAEAYNSLGNAMRDTGQFDQAIAAYRQAVALKPGYAQAHWNLARAGRITAADPRLAALENLARDVASLSENEQVPLHFALGKAYADLDQQERAFGHLLKGNALQRRRVRYDEAAMLAWFDRVKAVFTADLMQQKKGLGDPSDVPVFILGMPRSGTTLIEQVLASHPMVFGAGELTEIASMVAGFDRGDHGPARFPEVVALFGQEELRGLGARYVRNISALAPAATPDTGRMPVPRAAQRITDKMPDNFRFAGFIHLALPHARIIHARRDPVDTCLSCFSHLFIKGTLEWSYDLGELGRYYRAYAALMDHWRRVLGEGVMLDVQYEDLVTDFEPQARRMVAFCGLEWDDRCLAFHETKRPVRTASAMQVRQPIYRSSIGRWRPYKDMLRPLLDELGY